MYYWTILNSMIISNNKGILTFNKEQVTQETDSQCGTGKGIVPQSVSPILPIHK